ncbi:MAG TPA: alpha/beta hydrolase [Rhizomicrobium sp.]|nr:alpha/beta hydrolase [Rhizomicrobium sp.]
MAKLKALLAAGIALLPACSPFRAIDLLVPRDGYAVHRNLAFGADPRQRLDIYMPQGLKGPAPVLLFFYGGAWQAGSRTDYLAFGQAFASAGIVTAVADYRLYPQVKYPAFVEDAAAALAWLYAHAADYGGDSGRIFVSGHSAGAYNAVMLAAEPKFLARHGGKPDWIRGVIGLAGPYDFLPMQDPAYIDMFHGRNNLDSMPVNHVNGVRPAMLLATGDSDGTVYPRNTASMAAKLRSVGSSVKEIHYTGIGHVGLILSLVPGFRGMTSLRKDMLEFIHSHG